MQKLTDTAAAAVATDPVLTAMRTMLDQPDALEAAAFIAATAEDTDFMDGFTAALNLTGLADLKDFFVSATLDTAINLAGVTIGDFIGSGQGAAGGAL